MPELKNGSVSEASRIAHFMGLSNWKTIDDLKLAGRVRDGLPVRTVSTVVKRIDPHGRFVKETDIVPRSTFHRRKASASVTLTKDESEKIWALAKLFSEALRIYHNDSERVAFFMLKEHPLLGNRTPIELATESIAGVDLVRKLLAQADAGIAA